MREKVATRNLSVMIFWFSGGLFLSVFIPRHRQAVVPTNLFVFQGYYPSVNGLQFANHNNPRLKTHNLQLTQQPIPRRIHIFRKKEILHIFDTLTERPVTVSITV